MLLPTVLLAATLSTGALALPHEPLTRRSGTEYRNFIIDDNCASSLSVVKKAIEGAYYLAKAGANVSPTSHAYVTWMDPTSNPTRYKTTVSRFENIATVLSPTTPVSRKVKISCDEARDECIKGATAAVDPYDRGDHFPSGTNGGQIYLCKKFLTTTANLNDALRQCMKTKKDELADYRNSANALLHEMTHLRLFMSGGTVDCLYGAASSKDLAKETPWVAMINADNYSYMALAAFLKSDDNCGREMAGTTDGSSGGLDNRKKISQCAADGSGWSDAVRKEHAAPGAEPQFNEENNGKKQEDGDGDDHVEDNWAQKKKAAQGNSEVPDWMNM